MKKFVSAALIGLTMFGSAAIAAPNYSFGNVSINKLDWSSSSVEKAQHHKDFDYIELEGGAGFDWGDIYGFADFEKFADYKSMDDVQISTKAVITLNTAIEDVSVYHHTYAVISNGFNTRDHVLGAAYSIKGDNWSVRPFVGAVYSAHDSHFNGNWGGYNGGMFGWTAMYDFQVGGEKFTLSNWNEYTFDRDQTYLAKAGETGNGINGAAAIWWNVSPRLTTGVQYRYASGKLGATGDLGAAIYTVKFNF